MANKSVEIRFNAMVRSLRAVGCSLPVKVIPYNDELFNLPDGCKWWEDEKLFNWIKNNQSPNFHKKYLILTESNYQFVDPDIIFLKNPQEVLSEYDGFITSCGHWNNPENTVTKHSERIFKDYSTTWPSLCFNGGQFACDQKLYEIDSIIKISENNDYRETLIYCETDQPPLNLLVLLSGVKIKNLTLPPYSMASTWSGDYDNDYKRYWTTENKTPYLIHWAGDKNKLNKPIDKLFLDYLTPNEINSINNNQVKENLLMKIKSIIKNLIR